MLSLTSQKLGVRAKITRLLPIMVSFFGYSDALKMLGKFGE